MENRVEFCCHTKMSKLQGINEAKEYIEEAVQRGYKAISITDTDSTQSFFYINDYLKYENKNKDFKVIYGTELHFKENKNSEKIYSIYIYLKNYNGIKNLNKLVSNAYTNCENGNYFTYRKELNNYRNGLLYASIGTKSEVYQNIETSQIQGIIDYYDFIGIEPNESKKSINLKIHKICSEQNKLIIGTSECNFINKEDYICNEVLNFYKKSSNIEIGNNSYFQTTEELINSFNYLENAKEIVVDNTIKLADSINQIWLNTPKDIIPKIDNSTKILSEKCVQKAKELYGEKLPKEVEDRLSLELQSILTNNFDSIYLISSELVEYSNKLGYKVGSRGSVGNSIVAYLLGITHINPLEYNLPFEMFAGKNYDKEPDIDLNFSEKIQSKIFEYLQNKYGNNKVIWGGTIGSLADRTVEKCCEEFAKSFELENIFDKSKIIPKLTGVKKCTGEHPGGIFILPEDVDITDICPTEIGEKNHLKTHCDYHSIWTSGFYKFDILANDATTMVYELEKETNTNSDDIKLDNKETLKMFLHANDNSYPISTKAIPGFETTYIKKMIEIIKPCNFMDLVLTLALSYGTDTWTYNANSLIEDDHKKVDEVISNRADMYNYFVSNGIEKNTAFDIVEFIRKGKASYSRRLWENERERYFELNEKWKEYKEILQKHNIPEWYIKSASKIKYLFPKAHAIGYTINAFKIAWYKINYPKAFYKAYFKLEPNFNVKDYYCKRQVKTELNRLYDLKEIHENNRDFDYDYNTDDKINNLELVLEMFNRGILKEKEEIHDDYNLINSRAISDYCRSIKHPFNTEELAVLVYRNNKMSIEEKINKYKDLIKNYPDMEVIERINCEHYASVKTMIKKEIQRLQILKKKLEQEGENCIWVWTEYNKSTLKYEHRSDLEHTFKTYKETFRDIQDYIKEFDDTLSFSITKKYFDKRKSDIYAEFNVEDKKIKLINIKEYNDNFHDIDMIFVNIPTPFKKGDILIQESKSMRNVGDEGNIFVLDYLCTWRDNLKELLLKGNYDSSDMIGYGYYLVNEDTTEFVRDHKWDYDSFEYYDGELKGRLRILKDISSFIKEKIDLELFIHAYDYYKSEFKNIMPNFYTDEGLKLAGMSEEDIIKANHKNG